MAGMTWIKHYTGVLVENDEVGSIFEKFKFEGLGRYWHLLEILGQKFSEDEETILLTSRSLRDSLRFKSYLQLDSFLLASELQAVFGTVKHAKHFEFNNSILLELKSRDFKSARRKRTKTAYKSKSKEEEKEEEKEVYRQAKLIVDYWNFLDLKKAPLTPAFLQEIKRSVEMRLGKSQGENQIKKAITNYSKILNSKESWYSGVYDLRSFLSGPKSDQFFPGEFEESNFFNEKQASKVSKYAN